LTLMRSSRPVRDGRLEAGIELDGVIALALDLFGELGFEKASVAKLAKKARVSVERLLSVFPGGEDEIAARAVEYADALFEEKIIRPLARGEPEEAIARMWHLVELYFQTAGRSGETSIVLEHMDGRLVKQMRVHFRDWMSALRAALVRAGIDNEIAWHLAVDALGGMRREILLSTTLRDDAILTRGLRRCRARLDVALRIRSETPAGPQT
jgi:TetR/AcrR family transcriptional repressor of lmrAB and yxaGH operons